METLRDSVDLLPATADEPIARYLPQKDRYRRNPPAVKPVAFLPDAKGETSVFRIFGMTPDQAFLLGDRYLNLGPDRLHHGYAELRAGEIDDVGLRLERDNSPPRHAAIVGWPGNEEDRLDLALQLSQRCGPPLLRTRR
jgi:hypothetical protein